MLADVLTKQGVDSEYIKEVAESSMWCLGPDSRCQPSRRGRKLAGPLAMSAKKEPEST